MSENKSIRQVAALFTREDSIYATLPGVDSWPRSRNALNWPGGGPVVAHPPCRSWGRLSHLAKPRAGEHGLARWAVRQVRREGGVLEHPKGSKLWDDMNLPAPGHHDKYSGWTLSVDQYWWGHQAQKPTWLYIVGVGFRELRLPFALGDAPKVITNTNSKTERRKRKNGEPLRPKMHKKEREKTPPDFANWLVELARRSRVERER